MIRNARKILGYMLLGVVGAVGLTISAQSILYWQAGKRVEADLNVSAELMLERANDATQTAIALLNRLALSSGLSCTSDHRYLYSEATRSTAWIDTIGLVDRNGNLVCTDMGQSARQAGLLPPYQADSNDVTLSLSGGTDEDKALSLLVVRHVANGRRLVARIPGEIIKLDPIRSDLRRFRVAMLSLGTGSPWYILEPSEAGGAPAVRIQKQGEFLPFEAQISVPEKALEAVTKETRRTLHVFGLVLSVFGIIGGYFFGRYRPNEGDRLLDAMESGELAPHMQPIIDLDTGAITGCEVLARWNKKDGSVVLPHEFIPLALNYHLTREVTRHIMSETRDNIETLLDNGQSFKVSFNLFSRQLNDDQIVTDICDVFKDSKLGFDNLIFEISDRMQVADVELAKDIISQIQALGAEIALDDVGSGHSGLYNLTSIGVDILKLDKIMVDSLKNGFAGTELIRGLIDLAASLNIGVIAEGIENEQQVVQLRKMGVSAAQGYLFAPPLPASAFVDLIKASRARKAQPADDFSTAEEIEDAA